MIDNFELIKSLMNFESEDEFYFIQIIQRKKDNPIGVRGSNNNNRLIKAYYIKSIEQLDRQKEEMITLANVFNARIGINLNKRSLYKTGFNVMKKIAEQMGNNNFHDIHRAYNSVCGLHNGNQDRLWLLDFDYHPTSVDWDIDIKGELSTFQPIGNKVKAIIPTKVGVHVIVSAFDSREFVKRYPDVDIHKNNPTILYIP